MAWGNGNLGGGGGGFNYKVVGGTSRPSNPKENMIWVNTDVEITSHIFSATQPENPVEGMVWFETRNTSPVAFNALKKNTLTVYPTACKQYVSGAWVYKEAMIYQAGTWKSWILRLYSKGVINEEATGGLAGYAYRDEGSGSTVHKPTVTIGDTSITLKVSGSEYSAGSYWTENKINLTNYNTLNLNVTAVSQKVWIYAALEKKNNFSFSARASSNAAGVLSLSVSELEGEFYLAIGMAGASSMTVTFDDWWLG